MRTERVFLMELFLDDETPKKIKHMIKERITELEEHPVLAQIPKREMQLGGFLELPPTVTQQSPSMQRIMAANPDLIPKPPTPVTPAAAQALAARQALLNSAGSERPENGRRSPRKI